MAIPWKAIIEIVIWILNLIKDGIPEKKAIQEASAEFDIPVLELTKLFNENKNKI